MNDREAGAASGALRPRRSSKRRVWLFRFVTMMFLFGCAELLAYFAMSILGAPLSTARLREEQDATSTGAIASDGGTEAIHPYLGWVRNPQLSIPEKFGTTEIHTNNLGFLDNGPSVRKRSPDRFLVCLAGGSVAWQFSWEAEKRLTEHLKTLPALQDRSIEFVRIAMPGYKQPQQLMALNYVLALGAEFDLVINMDGFNDGVLAIVENVTHGTSLDYPRSWHARSLVMTDPQISDQAYRLLKLRADRQQRAKQALGSWFRWSWCYQLVWYLRDNAAREELLELGIEVNQANDRSFLHHGPAVPDQSPAAHRRDAALLWARCSEQMHDLCKARGIAYLHVLQPNQYVDDSKPLSDYERENCFAGGQPMAETARSVFPELVAEGKKLSERGIAFSDQTMVFRSVTETLYVDPWCHFNQQGNDLLADAVFEQLQRAGLLNK